MIETSDGPIAADSPEGAALMLQSGIKSAAIDVVVIRANGKREDLGTVSYFRRPDVSVEDALPFVPRRPSSGRRWGVPRMLREAVQRGHSAYQRWQGHSH